MAKSLFKRIFPHGFASVALLAAGIYALTRGFAYLPLFVPAREELPTGLVLLESVMPIHMWAGVWMLGGVIAVGRSFTKNDSVAWGIVLGTMTAWGLGYTWGWVDSLFEGAPSREWVSALSYLGPVAVVIPLLLHGQERGRE